MRTKDGSEWICVLCDDKEQQALVQEEEDTVEIMENEEIRMNRREQTDKATALLGEKMLQGWTLLGEECPNTSCFAIPLVQNREKQKYCVNCGHFVKHVSDEDFVALSVPEVPAKRLPDKPVVAKEEISRKVSETTATMPCGIHPVTETLYDTLSSLQRQLRDMPPTHIDQVQRLCVCIRECAAAIQKVKEIE